MTVTKEQRKEAFEVGCAAYRNANNGYRAPEVLVEIALDAALRSFPAVQPAPTDAEIEAAIEHQIDLAIPIRDAEHMAGGG